MEISSAVVGRILELSVRDFGPGVPDDEKAQQVFDRFVRGEGVPRTARAMGSDSTSSRSSREHTAERTHGWADAPGGGAVFTIGLPIVDARITVAPDLVIPPRPAAPAAARRGPRSSLSRVGEQMASILHRR